METAGRQKGQKTEQRADYRGVMAPKVHHASRPNILCSHQR